jgi:hypothetical protein
MTTGGVALVTAMFMTVQFDVGVAAWTVVSQLA